jgi:hypothetical protein
LKIENGEWIISDNVEDSIAENILIWRSVVMTRLGGTVGSRVQKFRIRALT